MASKWTQDDSAVSLCNSNSNFLLPCGKGPVPEWIRNPSEKTPSPTPAPAPTPTPAPTPAQVAMSTTECPSFLTPKQFEALCNLKSVAKQPTSLGRLLSVLRNKYYNPDKTAFYIHLDILGCNK
jgi:hypothetical protein